MAHDAPLVIQITDARALDEASLFARIDAAAALGSRYAVMLRDPELVPRELLAKGRALRDRLRHGGARLLVNDRLDLAQALSADGVHLGRLSVAPSRARALLGEGVLVTVSAHDVDEAVARAASGALAVLLSPIFVSPGKGPALGLEALARARRRLPPEVALIALGGVDAENAYDCLAAGADGVASVRAELHRLFA